MTDLHELYWTDVVAFILTMLTNEQVHVLSQMLFDRGHKTYPLPKDMTQNECIDFCCEVLVELHRKELPQGKGNA